MTKDGATVRVTFSQLGMHRPSAFTSATFPLFITNADSTTSVPTKEQIKELLPVTDFPLDMPKVNGAVATLGDYCEPLAASSISDVENDDVVIGMTFTLECYNGVAARSVSLNVVNPASLTVADPAIGTMHGEWLSGTCINVAATSKVARVKLVVFCAADCMSGDCVLQNGFDSIACAVTRARLEGGDWVSITGTAKPASGFFQFPSSQLLEPVTVAKMVGIGGPEFINYADLNAYRADFNVYATLSDASCHGANVPPLEHRNFGEEHLVGFFSWDGASAKL